jgi:REP element-mobilizing transposase RayT
MVIGHHVIFTAYGFWLPNDPRGSWSDWVRSWDLFLHGRATKTDERRSVARRPHDQEKRNAAKLALKYDPVRFTGLQARSIAVGFREAVKEADYHLLACSILSGHVHLVMEPHVRPVERIVGHLKARATQQLAADGLHPFVQMRDAVGRFPSVWSRRCWKVFLFTSQDVE